MSAASSAALNAAISAANAANQVAGSDYGDLGNDPLVCFIVIAIIVVLTIGFVVFINLH